MSSVYYRDMATGLIVPFSAPNLALTPSLLSATGYGVTNGFDLRPSVLSTPVPEILRPGQSAYGNVVGASNLVVGASIPVASAPQPAQIDGSSQLYVDVPAQTPPVSVDTVFTAFPASVPYTSTENMNLHHAAGGRVPGIGEPSLSYWTFNSRPGTWYATPVSSSIYPYRRRVAF